MQLHFDEQPVDKLPASDADLAPSYFVDSDHPDVIAFTDRIVQDITDARTRAIRLFEAVREEITYNPYSASLEYSALKASAVVHQERSFCVPKAVLLAACARRAGIPARVGFSDVTNHLSSERLRTLMKSDIFAFHGYVALFFDDRWIKVTPAFNSGLCRVMGVSALEFDGEHDALFHPYDIQGHRFMEYIHDHGLFRDLPYALMLRTWQHHYPHLMPEDLSVFFEDSDLTAHRRAFFEGDLAKEANASVLPPTL